MMMHNYLRLLPKKLGSITDISLDNQDELAQLAFNYLSSDYLYMGQEYPFNNFFVHVLSGNMELSEIKIEYWSGKEWIRVVDILDGTKAAGATIAKSGVIQFTPNDRHSWMRIDDTSSNTGPSELNSLTIYNLFWLRISFTNALSVDTTTKEIGYSFTSSQMLDNLDVEINQYMAAFKTGKIDWIDEIKTASRILVLDFKRLGLIIHAGQLIRFDDLYLACTYKALEVIYMNLGPAYNEKRMNIRKMYDEAMNLKYFTIDENEDARTSVNEIGGRTRRLIR